jgi:hypothetical protein
MDIALPDEEETRSLTRMVCGSTFPVEIGFGPAAIEAPDVIDGADVTTAPVVATAGDWTFFNVSSTSADCHPAATNVALIVSPETPVLSWELIYSTS